MFCLLSNGLALSTIEGLVDRAVAGLEQDQPIRKVGVLSVQCTFFLQ